MKRKRERDIDDINLNSSVKKGSTSSDTFDIKLLSKEIAHKVANDDGYSEDEIDCNLSALLLSAIHERKRDSIDVLLRHKAQVLSFG